MDAHKRAQVETGAEGLHEERGLYRYRLVRDLVRLLAVDPVVRGFFSDHHVVGVTLAKP